METTTINSKFEGSNYATVISNGKHQIINDEPIEDGGQDKGLNPYELILAGLATCTTATVKMYADRKGWKIGKMSITAILEENNVSRIIKTTIEITGNITEEQKSRLLLIAKKCPVHKLLSAGNQIETILN
ncbi:OsmC family protein [Flavobacterium sp.]|uniref:OsmC family protein n=1 Tax=Flavobacterium sp. TaxID=239 RepID=UPI002602E99C|nr:OsmC family protein [Flavobacterium sp.]